MILTINYIILESTVAFCDKPTRSHSRILKGCWMCLGTADGVYRERPRTCFIHVTNSNAVTVNLSHILKSADVYPLVYSILLRTVTLLSQQCISPTVGQWRHYLIWGCGKCNCFRYHTWGTMEPWARMKVLQRGERNTLVKLRQFFLHLSEFGHVFFSHISNETTPFFNPPRSATFSGYSVHSMCHCIQCFCAWFYVQNLQCYIFLLTSQQEPSVSCPFCLRTFVSFQFFEDIGLRQSKSTGVTVSVFEERFMNSTLTFFGMFLRTSLRKNIWI